MLNVQCEGQEARVSVVGEIDEGMILELVDTIQYLCENNFYREVELEIASPGGSIHALDYFVEALAGFRERGWSIATRALTAASSAAAVLVSLGDHRVASRSSRLLYHPGRFRLPETDVNASRAATMLEALDGADRRLVQWLAQRGRNGPVAAEGAVAPSIEDFRESDWPIVARLTRTAVTAGRRKPPDELLAKLRKRVARALKSRSAQLLEDLYMELFAIDAFISAALALELRLIDAVSAKGSAVPAAKTRSEGTFRIPEWRALFPLGCIDREALCRHTLAFGETGSGKTVSGILPVVNALFDRDNRVGCALVVDPKRDIEPVLRQFASEGHDVRTLDISGADGSCMLNLMAGPHSIEDDLANDRVMTAAAKMLVRVSTLSPNHPARSLAGVASQAHNPYWEQEGARMAQVGLALVLLVLQHRDTLFGPEIAVRLGATSNDARQALSAFAMEAGFAAPSQAIESRVEQARKALASETEKPPEVIRTDFSRSVRTTLLYRDNGAFRTDFDALRAQCAEPEEPQQFNDATRDLLDRVLLASCRAPTTHDRLPTPGIPRRMNVMALASIAMDGLFTWRLNCAEGTPSLAATSVCRLLDALIDAPEARDLSRAISSWQNLATGDYRGHYNGILGHATACFRDFADPLPAGTLFFGCEPFYLSFRDGQRPGEASPVDFSADVDADGGRRVYVVHPSLGRGPDVLIAKALKACFFEAILNSDKRRNAGRTMPLVAYIADEFHRFVTSDRTHGEQSFLDTCRSFGTFCVLACQTISSLHHALAENGGPSASNGPAVSMVVTNTGTKLIFRSTDPEMNAYVGELCPANLRGCKVTEVRPLSTLAPGECYAATADGRFERRQLDPCQAIGAPGTEVPERTLGQVLTGKDGAGPVPF